MLEEGEITSNPMEQMRSPSAPEDPPAVLTNSELRLLRVPRTASFRSRRGIKRFVPLSE
jgi:hypothetical protein